MPQGKKSSREEGAVRTKQEVCGYIHDLLGSLQTIAAQHELPVLARLISMAKSEARDCR